jgi:cytochrome c peroxidase
MNQRATRSEALLVALFLGGVGVALGCDDSKAGPTGAAGTTGSAGTSGSAGDTGTAGSGGSTSSAGSGGSAAGSTGGGGTTGVAGSTQADGGTDAATDPLAGQFTPAQLAKVRTLLPLPAVPADTTNMYADNAAAATLGQRLFFDKRYSGALVIADDGTNGGLGMMGDTGKISCASCHAGRGLDDRRSIPGNVSLGADFLTRNSLPLVNSSFYGWTNWAGRFAAQWELPIAVVENAKNMNGDRMRVVHLIFDKYKADYEAVFGGTLDAAISTDTVRFPPSAKPKASATAVDGPWEMMTAADREIATRIYVNFAKALEAYMRKLVSRNAPLDRFVAGDVDALGDDEIRGLKLFVGSAGCIGCHGGATLSDGKFHNIGVGQTGPHVPASDNARFADITSLLGAAVNVDSVWSDDRTSGRLTGLTATPGDETKGQFRTPSLRGIAETAPYMHAGQLATLEEVIAFYDRGGDAAVVGTKDPNMVPLGLSTRDRADLAAFLRTLTGEAVPATLLTDTSAP